MNISEQTSGRTPSLCLGQSCGKTPANQQSREDRLCRPSAIPEQTHGALVTHGALLTHGALVTHGTLIFHVALVTYVALVTHVALVMHVALVTHVAE